MGLVCCAVAIPFGYILGEAFAKSNEPEFPELQLSWPLKFRIFKLHQRWNWAQTRPNKVMVRISWPRAAPSPQPPMWCAPVSC